MQDLPVFEFSAKIISTDGGGAYVDVPFDVKLAFGKPRVKIKALFDDLIEYRGSLVRMGGPNHILIVLKKIRIDLAKKPGDSINVKIWEDVEPRIALKPDILIERLKLEPGLEEKFDNWGYSMQREVIEWINSAKKIETKLNRIEKFIKQFKG